MTRCACKCLSHNGFLTAKGLAEAAQRDVFIDGVAGMDMFGYLDKVGSVSGLAEAEDAMWPADEELDNQYQRFLHGS